MIDFISTIKMSDRSVVASCLLGTGFADAGLSRVAVRGNERPTKAPAVAAQVQAYAYAPAFALAAEGAGDARQKTQHHMWAFRGHEPWRDPA